MPNSQTTLNEELFSQSVRLLTGRDEHLAEVVKAYGQPPLWVREPGFPTLVYIILEQQVSLASARAAFERLKAAVRPLTPKGFLRLNDAELLRIGFSRQKTLTPACLPNRSPADTLTCAISTASLTTPRTKCSWPSRASAAGRPTFIC